MFEIEKSIIKIQSLGRRFLVRLRFSTLLNKAKTKTTHESSYRSNHYGPCLFTLTKLNGIQYEINLKSFETK